MESLDEIRTEAQPRCPLCGGDGEFKYRDLKDALFGAPGAWSLKECGDCSALWLDPRPTRQDVGKAYRQYYTHGAPTRLSVVLTRVMRLVAKERAAARFGFPGSLLKHLAAGVIHLKPGLAEDMDLMARHLPASAMGSGQLLDVGCGDGRALEYLRDLGWRCSGVEADAGAVEAARARGFDVRLGAIDDVGFRESGFDATTSSHVLEHVHDPLDFLVKSRKMLKAGGTLVAVTPNVDAATHMRYGRNWMALDPPRHLVLFNAQNLRRIAETAGLRDVRVVSSARAVGLSHIASTKISRDSVYHWNRWPGFHLWLGSQARQLEATRRLRLGQSGGEELVLIGVR